MSDVPPARGGIAWELPTGAKPACARPKAEVRPPRWAASATATYGRKVRARADRSTATKTMTSKKLETFKAKQAETLSMFRKYAEAGTWDKLHRHHFDWWMFPIDDGSKAEFNLCSEEDVAALQGDPQWLEGYHEALKLAAAAWGWDLEKACRIEPPETGMAWTNWDVRLAKMCRSLYLMEEETFLDSLQKFARDLQEKEKEGKGFFYGTICLDELLYFQLPRTQPSWPVLSKLPRSCYAWRGHPRRKKTCNEICWKDKGLESWSVVLWSLCSQSKKLFSQRDC